MNKNEMRTGLAERAVTSTHNRLSMQFTTFLDIVTSRLSQFSQSQYDSRGGWNKVGGYNISPNIRYQSRKKGIHQEKKNNVLRCFYQTKHISQYIRNIQTYTIWMQNNKRRPARPKPRAAHRPAGTRAALGLGRDQCRLVFYIHIACLMHVSV